MDNKSCKIIHFKHFRTAILIMMAAVCLFLSPTSSGRASARTVRMKVSSAKRNGKKVNFHSMLPKKYRSPYHVMQGTATDGKYVYLNYWKKDTTKGVMVKLDGKTFRKVKVSKPLFIHHGNDMTYNPNTGLLYVVYSSKDPFQITIVNPRTLTVCGHKKIRLPAALEGATPEEVASVNGLVGITYNKSRNQYAMRVGNHCDFIVFDAFFNALRYVHAEEPKGGLRRQSLDSDDNRVYVCLDKSGSYNVIMAYDWYGNLKCQMNIPLTYELEGMYHYGSKLYAAFYNKYGPTSHIYRLKMP